MKKFWLLIKLVFYRLKKWIIKKTRKKSSRIFVVIRSNEPSMMGNFVVGVPKVGVVMNAIDNNHKGYMTIHPQSIAKRKDGDVYVIYGKYNKVTIKRIR